MLSNRYYDLKLICEKHIFDHNLIKFQYGTCFKCIGICKDGIILKLLNLQLR